MTKVELEKEGKRTCLLSSCIDKSTTKLSIIGIGLAFETSRLKDTTNLLNSRMFVNMEPEVNCWNKEKRAFSWFRIGVPVINKVYFLFKKEDATIRESMLSEQC